MRCRSGRNQSVKQNQGIKQKMLSEVSECLLGPTSLEGRVMGARCSSEGLNFGMKNLVGNKRRSPLHFKSNWIEHAYGKKIDLRNSDWARKSLTIEVIGEGKRKVAWNKGDLKSSLWVSKDQREHVSKVSRVQNFFRVRFVQDGPVVGLPSFPEPIGPSWLEVGESPTVGDPRSLSLEAQVLSKTPHEASVASTDQDIAEESSTPPEKAGTARHQASMMTATSSATQIVTSGCPAKATVMERGPFPIGFHAGASSATLERAVLAPFHTTRSDLGSAPPSELLGCHAETLAEDESLFLVGFAPSTLRSHWVR